MRTSLRERLWRYWVAAVLFVMLVYFAVLPHIKHAQQVCYFIISASVVVCIVVGVRMHRPERKTIWCLIAAGQITYALADGIWNTWEIVSKRPVPYPSLADPFWLAAYPLWIGGLLIARRRNHRASHSGTLIDAAIIMVGVSVVSWVFLMRPYFVTPDASTLAKLTSVAYPIVDLFLVGMVAPMLRSNRDRTRSHTLLLGWVLSFFVSDTIYGLQTLHGWYRAGSWLDAGWFFAYLLLGAAALHPSMAAGSPTRTDDENVHSMGRLRLTLLTVATTAGPLLLLFEIDGELGGFDVVAMATLVLGGLILARLTGLVRESERHRRQLADAMDQLSYRALHDPLTGLANRALFADRIEHAVARAGRTDFHPAVLLLDLDDFKAVNDGMGHEAGDELLVAVAARLKEATRDSDTVARLGGDEFAILVEDAEPNQASIRVAERVLAALAPPFDVGGRTVFVGGSLGIARHDPSSGYTDTLRHADVAMYMAKSAGKGRYAQFRPEMGDAAVVRIEVEADIRSTLEHRPDDFVVHYQPIVDLCTRRVTGLEALVRWKHPTRGLVAPLDFLPVAEETGLIVPLGRLVLRNACAQVARWRRELPGMEHLSVSVNLSSRQVQDAYLIADVKQALLDAQLDAQALTLELTEDLLLHDVDRVESTLSSLSMLGIRISVDDFGAGNSPLSYLKRFPISELKIDKSYVDDLTGVHADPSLVQGLIELGHAIHLRTIAEGIEDPQQVSVLRGLGCESGQGFLFARPRPSGEIEELLLADARDDPIAEVVAGI